MKLFSMTKSLHMEHHIPVKGSEEDLLAQVGSETIDLNGINRDHIEQKRVYDLDKLRAFAFDDDEAMYRIKYSIRAHPEIQGNHEKYWIELEFDSTLRELIRTKVSFLAKKEFVSYTSKKHNILIPQWLTFKAKGDIRKSMTNSTIDT